MTHFFILILGVIIGIIFGVLLVTVSTKLIGSLIIDEKEEKDIFRFEFKIPPEDLIKERNKHLVFLYIKRSDS